MIRVPPDGAQSARLVLIGEAPGSKETEQLRPLVGPTYHQRLRPWWKQYGLPDRHGWYIDNVCPYQPQNIDRVPRDEMERHISDLHDRLASLDDPWLIVPTGNYALYALTGKGKVSWHKKDGRQERPGILSWRGSIVEYRDRRGRRIKVIPTIHPAATFRVPKYETACRHDWRRIGEDQQFRELRVPQSEYRISPSLSELEDFAADVAKNAHYLSVDIETPRHMLKKNKRGAAYLGCIGFAYTTDWSLTVPMTLDYWGSEAAFTKACAVVKFLLMTNVDKVGQNFATFDWWWLLDQGFAVGGYLWDLRAMHHCANMREPHDLAYIASTLTRRPYWKDEAKDPDEIMKYASNKESLWTYCGMDVCGTLDAFQVAYGNLATLDLLEYYDVHYGSMYEDVLYMSRHGLNADHRKRVAKQAELMADCVSARDRMNAAAGFNLVASKGVSTERLGFLLYGDNYFQLTPNPQKKIEAVRKKFPEAKPYGYPVLWKKDPKTKKRRPRADEVAVRRLMLEHEELIPVGEAVLEFQRKRKLKEFLDEKLYDTDGRIRSSIALITKTGRMASQKTPLGKGRNLQNWDRGLRDVIVPDRETEAA